MRRNKHARKVSAEPAGPVSLFRRLIRKRGGGGMGMADTIPFHLFRRDSAGMFGGMRRNGGIDP
jgi:hypothetical protein